MAINAPIEAEETSSRQPYFFSRVGDKIEILRKASKKNEAEVIKQLKKLYQ